MTDKEALQAALGDVRRAYRLLWCYQDRLFDIVGEISGLFGNLRFYQWHPNSAARIDGGTDPRTRSAWFAFPMMNVSYLYRSGDDPNYAKLGDWMLEIRVVSDSGFDDIMHSPWDADPNEFAGIEATTSRIDLHIFYFTQDFKGNLLNDMWKSLEWPTTDGELGEPSTHPVRTIGASFNIADLGDKDDVTSATRSFKKQVETAFGLALT